MAEPLQPQIHGYDRTFWVAYVSNGLTTMANAMLVRYADFVDVLGGEERQLGLIVGAGMVGSIVFRLAQGEAIDRFGAWRIWRWCSFVYAFSLFLHLLLSTAYGPAIFGVRLLMQSSLAGIFGASITFVSLRVPTQRMAEMIGALGTSGFLGIMAGPVLSDWLASGGATGGQVVTRMFWTSGGLAFAGAVTAWWATRESTTPKRRRRPHLGRVIPRYMPLVLACAAAAMGAGFNVPMTFLRPFAVAQKLAGVGTFFVVYASTAFVARLATRSLFERHGNRPWILAGLALLAVSFLCYLPVSRTWHLAVPGAIAGVAHALLFPSIMSAGTSAFPRRYLGVSTSVMLAMFDVGTLFGAPVVGAFLRAAKPVTPYAYHWMFAATAAVLAAVTILVAVDNRRRA